MYTETYRCIMKAKNKKAFEVQHKQQSQLVTSLQATLIILLILQQVAFFCVQLENVNHFFRKISPCDLHLKMGSVRGMSGNWWFLVREQGLTQAFANKKGFPHS